MKKAIPIPPGDYTAIIHKLKMTGKGPVIVKLANVKPK
jgi:hypothetical protein